MSSSFVLCMQFRDLHTGNNMHISICFVLSDIATFNQNPNYTIYYYTSDYFMYSIEFEVWRFCTNLRSYQSME